jgi:glycosyltransferase involved in cell wall biosynthesis
MPRHDVAIYTPESVDWYERAGGQGGGAERQTMLLARALSTCGLRVAHIVFSPNDPVALPPRLTLVPRKAAGAQSLAGRLQEIARVWRALSSADARVTIVRGNSPALGVAAIHSKVKRRRLIFSSASDSDFASAGTAGRSFAHQLYRIGVRLADVIVVQSEDQTRLAHQLPGPRRIAHIPSFCEPVGSSDDSGGELNSMIWVGRVRSEKAPLRYVELAKALPDARFTMIPVVLDSKREYHELQEAARSVENLELLERCPHPQLMKLISRAAAVVNTSDVEGLPNVFLEAWAQGVPVLSLKCDPDGIIARRKLGIATSGSWERFVAGARELLNGGFPRAEFSRRARAYVEEVHSVDAVATRWAEVIAGLA